MIVCSSDSSRLRKNLVYATWRPASRSEKIETLLCRQQSKSVTEPGGGGQNNGPDPHDALCKLKRRQQYWKGRRIPSKLHSPFDDPMGTGQQICWTKFCAGFGGHPMKKVQVSKQPFQPAPNLQMELLFSSLESGMVWMFSWCVCRSW